MESNAKNTRFHPRKQCPASPSPQHPPQRQVGGLGGSFSVEEGGCGGSEMQAGRRCFRPASNAGAAGEDKESTLAWIPLGPLTTGLGSPMG